MIHERIKQLRENTKMNKKDFAAFLGVKYTTYNNYETGAREPSSDFLILISKKFDISIDYLMGLSEDKDIGHSYTLKTSEIEHIEKYRALDNHGTHMVDFVLDEEYSRSLAMKEMDEQDEAKLLLFPVSPSKAAAGSGYLLFDDGQNEIWKVIDNELIRKADIGIIVFGDSMEPLYSDGDVLLVRKQPDIEIGEIGIFIKDGQGYVKKKGIDRLISLNKARPDIFPSEYGDITCFGKVIGILEPEWIVER